MTIYSDRNFQIDEISVIEFQHELDGSFNMICEVNGEEDFIAITREQYEEIKALHGFDVLLYMYSHRSHRGWKLDGFLPTTLDVYTLLEQASPTRSKLKIFNEAKDVFWEMENIRFNQKLNKVFSHIRQHGYKITDDTLANCSHVMLSIIIERMSIYIHEFEQVMHEYFDECKQNELKRLEAKRKRNA